MNRKGFFITGTDTGVGKTIFSSILMNKFNFDYWKPVQTGNKTEDDNLFIRNISKISENRFYKPSYSFKKPVSPHLAANYENRTINLNKIKMPRTFNHLIIEGAGGILVPLNRKDLMINLIKKFKLPVVVISKSVLGTINHTLMTVRILRENKIKIFGIVLNKVTNKKDAENNAKSIEYFGKVKVLAQIPFLKTISFQNIMNQTKRNIFNVFKI